MMVFIAIYYNNKKYPSPVTEYKNIFCLTFEMDEPYEAENGFQALDIL